MEQVLVSGDLSKLTPPQRVSYYLQVCNSVHLNPYTKPFDYISLNGKLVLYAKRDCTDQLRSINKISITKLEREVVNDIYVVTAYAQTSDGRQDSSIGCVSIKNLSGDALANAMMKAETKSKRRVTLSACGLGMMDETEVETTPAVKVTVLDNGEIQAKNEPVKPIKDTPADAQADEPEEGEAVEPLVYAFAKRSDGAKLGGTKGHEYPSLWVKNIMPKLAELGTNEYHVDGILQILRLPQDTEPEQVIAEIEAYMSAKDEDDNQQEII